MSEDEFLQAYDAFADALFRHCYFRILDREKSKDFVQETFFRTWEYIRAGKKIMNLRPFLYRVLNNVIIDDSRKRKSFSLDELHDKGFDPTEPIVQLASIETKMEFETVLRAMWHLDEEARKIITLRYIDGLGPKEIAQIMDTRENLVSVRLHRAIKELRKILPHG
jgi:RNA polymerase sigma-70 factor (ECF subfamily)